MAELQGNGTSEELYSNFPEPVPDYDADSDERLDEFPPPPPPLTTEQLAEAVAQAHEDHIANGDIVATDGAEHGLIKAKPLVNPVLESRERQAMHKELLINHKMGKDLLQKTELNKALRDRRDAQKKKEWEDHRLQQDKSSLEYKLMERANKLKEVEQKKEDDNQAPEFIKVMRKITRNNSEECS